MNRNNGQPMSIPHGWPFYYPAGSNRHSLLSAAELSDLTIQ